MNCVESGEYPPQTENSFFSSSLVWADTGKGRHARTTAVIIKYFIRRIIWENPSQGLSPTFRSHVTRKELSYPRSLGSKDRPRRGLMHLTAAFRPRKANDAAKFIAGLARPDGRG